MKKYRVLKVLSIGQSIVQPGGFLELELDERSEAYLTGVKGALGVISGPPLSELPGWKWRAARLEKAGILDAETLINADPADVSARVGVKRETIDGWMQELSGWLNPPSEDGDAPIGAGDE